jgi:membrane protease YdiL (CAAX protease family)
VSYAAAFFSILLIEWIFYYFIYPYWPFEPSEWELAISGSPLIAQIISAVILAPIGEEIVFRGFMTNRALSWMPKWAAVAVPAILFGVSHWSLSQGIPAAVMGIGLGLLYVRYRSVGMCILAHSGVNLYVTLINYFFSADNIIAEFIVVFAGLLLSIAAIVFLLVNKKAVLTAEGQTPVRKLTPSDELLFDE